MRTKKLFCYFYSSSDECGCRYGLVHEITNNEIRKVRECNFTDMVRCGNQYVKKFVFGTDDFVSEICKQPCQNLDFSVRIDFDH